MSAINNTIGPFYIIATYHWKKETKLYKESTKRIQVPQREKVGDLKYFNPGERVLRATILVDVFSVNAYKEGQWFRKYSCVF